MKITPKILSIPPYISTSWTQIRSLYMQENNLVVCLANGTSISIPNLHPQEIETIFAAHSHFLNTPVQQESSLFLKNQDIGQGVEGLASMHLNLDNMESFVSVMQHNAEHAHMPDLPKEILSKIAGIAKIIAPGEIKNMPKPEPHCNCPHCQIAKAIHQGENDSPIEHHIIAPQNEEEIVHDKDLSFQQWEIKQLDEHRYSVTNRLDPVETYTVFLGESVGCTCGTSGCEHILAVLKS